MGKHLLLENVQLQQVYLVNLMEYYLREEIILTSSFEEPWEQSFHVLPSHWHVGKLFTHRIFKKNKKPAFINALCLYILDQYFYRVVAGVLMHKQK